MSRLTRFTRLALCSAVTLAFACSDASRQDDPVVDAGVDTTDAGVDAGEQPPPKAPPGAACTEDADCAGEGAMCNKSQPGGYCFIPGCSLDQTDCPANSVCVDFTGEGDTFCLEGMCNVDDDCARHGEGYICDVDQSCWSYAYVPLNPGAAAMGAACTSSDQCESDLCVGEEFGFPGGYCTADCDPDEPDWCPSGSTCAEDHEGYMICQPTCEGADTCRDGYECIDGGCRPPAIDITQVKFGDACTESTAETACGQGGECLVNEGLETAWPDGYCVALGCDPETADSCGAHGKCLVVDESPVCFKACTAETEATDCRVDAGYACVAGVCQRPPANDVAKIKVGAACVADADCNADGGTGGRCLLETEGFFGTMLPGGMCVAPGCSLTDAGSCGASARCIPLGSSLSNYCVPSCTAQTSATACRENYVCDTDDTCWSYACEAAEDCDEGQTCNANGFCAPATP